MSRVVFMTKIFLYLALIPHSLKEKTGPFRFEELRQTVWGSLFYEYTISYEIWAPLIELNGLIRNNNMRLSYSRIG